MQQCAANATKGAHAGYACYEGLSCIQYDVSASGAYSTDYTYCSAESGVCVCSAGPIPVNDYCFIYGETLPLLQWFKHNMPDSLCMHFYAKSDLCFAILV